MARQDTFRARHAGASPNRLLLPTGRSSSAISRLQSPPAAERDVGWQIGDERRIATTVEVPMHVTIEHEREENGRWLAEVPELPGVVAYGATAQEAMARARALALRVLAERLEHDETGPQSLAIAVA